jgi:hypothetical protein
MPLFLTDGMFAGQPQRVDALQFCMDQLDLAAVGQDL